MYTYYFHLFQLKGLQLDSRAFLCSDADGNIVEMPVTDGTAEGSGGNATDTFVCSLENLPNATQECGSPKGEEGAAKPEEITSEVGQS